MTTARLIITAAFAVYGAWHLADQLIAWSRHTHDLRTIRRHRRHRDALAPKERR